MLIYRASAEGFAYFLDENARIYIEGGSNTRLGYLIGTRGQLCTNSLIAQKRAEYPRYAEKIDLYADQWIGKVVGDCMGVYEIFLNGGNWDKPLMSWKYSDFTTWTAEELVKTEGLPTGPMTNLPRNNPYPIAVGYPGHVGFFYKSKVYQCSGHHYGLEITELNSTSHNEEWQYWYMLPWLDYTNGGNDMIICKRGDKDSVTGNKNVTSMQTGLVKLDPVRYAMVIDGSYGPTTASVVGKFRTDVKIVGSSDEWDNLLNNELLFKLTALITNCQTELKIANQTIATLTQQINDLTQQLNAANAQITSLNKQLDEANAQITDLSNQLILAQSQIALLEKQLADAIIERDKAIADRDAKVKELTTLSTCEDTKSAILSKY
jgi:flagellar biosynthesis chaperone FliJ